jgi:hypothetical protein
MKGKWEGVRDCGFQVYLGSRKVVRILGLVDEGTTGKEDT